MAQPIIFDTDVLSEYLRMNPRAIACWRSVPPP